MSDQTLKNEVVKALEVALELSIDELLACELTVINSNITCDVGRRARLRNGQFFTPSLDGALYKNAELVQARDCVKKLAAALGALEAAKWRDHADLIQVTPPGGQSDD